MGNAGTITNEQIFELLQKTSQDVIIIKQDVLNFKEEIDSLKYTVDVLETENNKLKQQISQQEDLLKRKNILIFGLKATDIRPLGEILLDFFSKKLQIKIESYDLDNYYRIGKKKNTGNRPILVKFLRELTIREVFESVKNLKGTGLSIARDLSQEKREQNKILYDYLKIAKGKDFPAKIVKSKLIVGNDEYTCDTLRNIERDTFLEPVVDKHLLFPNSSAPSTPTINNREPGSSSTDDDAFIQPEVQAAEPIKTKVTEKSNVSRQKQKLKSKGVTNCQVNSQTPRSTRSGSTSNQRGVPRKDSNDK